MKAFSSNLVRTQTLPYEGAIKITLGLQSQNSRRWLFGQNLDKIWHADTEWNADDDQKVKIEIRKVQFQYAGYGNDITSHRKYFLFYIHLYLCAISIWWDKALYNIKWTAPTTNTPLQNMDRTKILKRHSACLHLSVFQPHKMLSWHGECTDRQGLKESKRGRQWSDQLVSVSKQLTRHVYCHQSMSLTPTC